MTQPPNAPLTDLQIDAFLDGQLWVLKRGSDTARLAARIIRQLYAERRKLREQNAALLTAMGATDMKHTERVRKG